MILFEVRRNDYSLERKDTLYLIEDNWDDWYKYSTLYALIYVDNDLKRHYIGGVKIGEINMQSRRPNIPNSFEKLDDHFFSLGSSDDYYSKLIELSKKIGNDIRETVLNNLNDIAKNLDLFKKVKNYDVTTTSLLRDITISTVKGQLNRMADGGDRLTPYDFKYILPCIANEEIELSFEVEPESMPPTNIHVLIGKNGVGKTTLLKNMIYALEDENVNESSEVGMFKMGLWSGEFANILFVSFSAFDDYLKISANEKIPYVHIGLSKNSTEGRKSYNELSEEFSTSLYKIKSGIKRRSWIKAIEVLESDNTFMELSIRDWININANEKELEDIKIKNPINYNEDTEEYQNKINKIYFCDKVALKFGELSSGHKVILLTITRLVETVEEKTLVLLDEPEEHLHPPLVSAFIRALSNLLIYRNGVGLVATHSPVIVQEVPQKCTWILRRNGKVTVAERPQIETFGENLGVLTSTIFGFEVTNSGFHKMVKDVVKMNNSYETALKAFNSELGMEARSILRSLMFIKEQSEEELDD